jgi:hypothetical protein
MINDVRAAIDAILNSAGTLRNANGAAVSVFAFREERLIGSIAWSRTKPAAPFDE